MVVADLASADEAIETIIEQGEGSYGHNENSHYNRFLKVRQEYGDLVAADPSFEPAFPAAHNPAMRRSVDAHDRTFIDYPEAAKVLDLANSLYEHVLRCLVRAFGRGAGEGENKRLFVNAAIDLMELLPPIGSHLATLPASKSHAGVNAGLTFTMLRDVARLPSGPGEKRIMAERVVEIAKHASLIFPSGHELAGTAGALDKIAKRFDVSSLTTVAHAPPITA
jgi:hypothetical protein